MSGIRLHPKYGVNPTLPVCLYCGKDKGEVALLGAAYKEEAPMHMVLDFEPCDACKAMIGDGVFVVEATEDRKPTGRLVGIKREAFERLFNIRPVPSVCFIEPKAFRAVFGKAVAS